ncbi:BrnA antitoxin family protein [Roseinatronobacter sp. S2]|uniref:BrnA antitoxin family protein n=1 Tax=Roseinatronobacter sp. S2 TaxID=3035471 RepID=UPI00240F9994|nr:BrnA antitoxin family protein [Roseinatronobacter sp. S2]WFE74038.1 BrnA antitoxin family protein [Roseinatronobacter sp. S2]
MSETSITRISLKEARQRKGGTDWERLRREDALGLEPETNDDEFELDWTRAELVTPEPKKMISLRVDPDVLDFFKSQGSGYQTRMNAVLRAWMDAQIKR